MRTYHSTRSNEAPLTAKEAIRRGIAPDGGLYVSDALGTVQIPLVDLSEMSYLDLAREVLRALLPGFSPAEIDACVSEAYEKTLRPSWASRRWEAISRPQASSSSGTAPRAPSKTSPSRCCPVSWPARARTTAPGTRRS